MNRALTGASVALLLFAGPVGCADDDKDPAVQTTPVASPAATPDGDSGSEALGGKDLECKDEIVRQMKDKSQETEDTPPECEGIDADRVFELATIADTEVKASSAKPTP